jgi:hypothetical protein
MNVKTKKQKYPTSRFVIGLGYVFILWAVIAQCVHLWMLVTYDAFPRLPGFATGTMVFGSVGACTIMIGECLKGLERRIANLEQGNTLAASSKDENPPQRHEPR